MKELKIRDRFFFFSFFSVEGNGGKRKNPSLEKTPQIGKNKRNTIEENRKKDRSVAAPQIDKNKRHEEDGERDRSFVTPQERRKAHKKYKKKIK